MRTLEATIEISASPEKAILAFSDAALLRGWWGVEKSLIELRPGGVYTLAWAINQQGIQYISSGIIKEYDPFAVLHIEKYIYLSPERAFLGPQELRVQAESYKTGCRLHLSQGPYPENAGADWDWYYHAVTDAWPEVLKALKKFLEENLQDEI